MLRVIFRCDGAAVFELGSLRVRHGAEHVAVEDAQRYGEGVGHCLDVLVFVPIRLVVGHGFGDVVLIDLHAYELRAFAS